MRYIKFKNNTALFLLLILGCSGSSRFLLDYSNLLIFPNCAKKSAEVFIPHFAFYNEYKRLPNDIEEFTTFLSLNDSLIYSNPNFRETKLLNITSDTIKYFISLNSYTIYSIEDSALIKNKIDSINIDIFSGEIFLMNINDSLRVTFDSLKIEGVSYSKGNKEYFNETKGPTINFSKYVQ